MSDEELFMEIVNDKINTGEYVQVDDKVYDYETGELICVQTTKSM